MYQDNRSIPLTSLLEKALGDSTTALLGERAAPDLLRLTPRTVSGAEMLQAVCTPVGIAPENVLVLAGSMPMLELVRAASRSAAAADAPAALPWRFCTAWCGMLKNWRKICVSSLAIFLQGTFFLEGFRVE